jgi:hypothetical protein
MDESKLNNKDGWAKQFIFYFFIILIKTDITFQQGKRKDIATKYQKGK